MLKSSSFYFLRALEHTTPLNMQILPQIDSWLPCWKISPALNAPSLMLMRNIVILINIIIIGINNKLHKLLLYYYFVRCGNHSSIPFLSSFFTTIPLLSKKNKGDFRVAHGTICCPLLIAAINPHIH